MTSAIQRIADAVGAPIGTSRRVVHGAETPLGVVWRRDDGHEFAVWRQPFDTDTLEVSHYDNQDELTSCTRYTIGELLPGDRVRTTDDLVGEVVASITRDLARVPCYESTPWLVSQAMVDRYEAGECTCLDPVPWLCPQHEA